MSPAKFDVFHEVLNYVESQNVLIKLTSTLVEKAVKVSSKLEKFAIFSKTMRKYPLNFCEHFEFRVVRL